MDDFKIIYKILKFLRDSMDFEEFDNESFQASTFGTNENRFKALLIQLQKSGHIEGLNVKQMLRQSLVILPPIQPRITIKGLEYLHDNGMMKKAAELLKGIVDVVL